MDLLTGDTTGAAVLVGFLAPYLIAIVNQPTWSPTARKAITVLISAALGAGIAYAAGTFHSGWTVLGAAATVLATSQAVYGRLFTGSVRRLELATSGRRRPPAPGRHAARETA